ncbi:MAG TPA: hypothetical protein VHX15_12025 [Frankiaceae bacterium]|jgi:hypothetical protein|nr:hypothetical protein [Frankiaceae bacterium]
MASSAADDVLVLFIEAHQRRRRRRLFIAAVALAAIGATTAAVTLTANGGQAHPAPVASPPAVPSLGSPPRLAWIDYQGQVHIGSLQSRQQRVVGSGSGSPVTSMVASGRTLFWVDNGGVVYDRATRQVRSLPRGVMAYDTATGRVRSFASDAGVFNAVGSTDVFVDSDDARSVVRYNLDGRLVARLTLPAGWVPAGAEGLGTSSPALAHGEFLVESTTPVAGGAAGAKLAVWTPATGGVRVLGDFLDLVATYTDSRGQSSLAAWLPYRCAISYETCAVQLTDLGTGVTRQILNPLGFGFDMRGAFSPDGRQLAAFAKTNSGGYDPQTRLALVDVKTGALRLVPGATIGIGEPVAWAQWLPASTQLIVGGTSGQDGAGNWGANHFLVDSTTLRATPFSFLTDGQKDVNYSAVLLP